MWWACCSRMRATSSLTVARCPRSNGPPSPRCGARSGSCSNSPRCSIRCRCSTTSPSVSGAATVRRRDRRARARGAGARGPDRRGGALPGRAVGGHAQAGGHRARDRPAAALHPVRRADHRPRPGDFGRDRSVDGAHPRAPAGDRNRRDARHAQRLHRGGPHRHVVRGQDPAGGDRGPDPGDGGSRGAAVHRGTPDVKRENEFAVGVVVIAAFAVVVTGALWLSGAHLGRTEAVYTARFRTVGGLGVGDPVVLRGVRVGRVEGIRLASGNWVEADLKIYAGAQPPPRPAVIAASASLFGEWAASLVPVDQLPNDPNIRQAIAEAQAAGSGKWPGATLPDIGQLTAQASRIATDIATVSSRIQSAFDSEAVNELRRSIKDFGQVADKLVRVTNDQADVLGSVGSNLRQGSDVLAKAATNFQTTLGRVDSATNQGQLATILNNSATTSANLRSASQDFRDLLDAAHKNQESLVRVLVSADSVMSRISNRSGTLGLLVSDSTLYRETTLTMIQLRQLLSDIQANPRKYFSFSVF